jgi:hypothetical protein
MFPSLKYFKRAGFLIFVLTLPLLMAGCGPAGLAPNSSTRTSPVSAISPDTPDSALSDWENAKRNGPQNLSVWGIGFDEASPKIPTVGFHTVRIEPGKSISAPFHFFNRSEEIQYRRIIVLLDERQQTGGIGNDPKNSYLDVTVEAGTEITLPISIPPLELGAHDLIIISILNPDDPIGLDFSRVTILVGADRVSAARNFTDLPDSHMSMENLSLFITDNIEEPPIELRQWLVTEALPAELVKYAVYVGYVSTSNQAPGQAANDSYHIAVLAFLDHQQIPIQESGSLAFYGNVYKNSIGRVLGNVRAPQKIGKHNLLVVLIDNPGTILGDSRSFNENNPAAAVSWFIDAQNVTIQVK